MAQAISETSCDIENSQKKLITHTTIHLIDEITTLEHSSTNTMRMPKNSKHQSEKLMVMNHSIYSNTSFCYTDQLHTFYIKI